MRLLGIFAFTIIGGTILNGFAAAAVLFAMDALGVPRGMNDAVLLLLLPVSYVFCAWAGSRLIRKKQAGPGAEAAAKSSFTPAPAVIAIAAILLVIGGINYLEYDAESSAKAFCEAAAVGTPMDKVAAAGRGKGTDRLRQIKPESVTVGFTGLPPYSRHFCEVVSADGKVTKARYFYLD